jgi:LacI family transcriptional regulator
MLYAVGRMARPACREKRQKTGDESLHSQTGGAMTETTQRNRQPHVAVFVDTWGSYGQRLLQGIADYVDTHGSWSLFVEMHSTGRFEPARLRRWRGDGVLAFIEDRRIAARMARSGVPTVETDGQVLDGKLPSVGNDEEDAGRLAAEHLLERRFTNFVYSGYADQVWVERRCQGFRDALAQAGYACEVRYYPRSFTTVNTWEKAQRELTAWLAELPKPLGVMACSDRHAQNILDACQRAHLVVPDDVAVIGTDNEEAVCRLSNPPLSSVANSPRTIGYESARLLDQMMSGQVTADQVEPILIPPQGVVTRRSTDVMVIDDAIVADALRFIRDHASESINVHDVVQQLSVSRSMFYRRFEKAMGRSPHEHILRVRMDRVKEFLVQTSLPLERVAALTGFEHTEYLVAVFKREVGITPGRYRAGHLQGRYEKP